jgi:hypothetical protein
MIWAINTTAQSSFGLTGAWGLASSSSVMLNSLESNPSGLTSLKDWGLSLSYGSEFSEGISSNLYLISLFKNTGDHFLTGRYSPGFQKEFIFNSSESIFSPGLYHTIVILEIFIQRIVWARIFLQNF